MQGRTLFFLAFLIPTNINYMVLFLFFLDEDDSTGLTVRRDERGNLCHVNVDKCSEEW